MYLKCDKEVFFFLLPTWNFIQKFRTHFGFPGMTFFILLYSNRYWFRRLWIFLLISSIGIFISSDIDWIDETRSSRSRYSLKYRGSEKKIIRFYWNNCNWLKLTEDFCSTNTRWLRTALSSPSFLVSSNCTFRSFLKCCDQPQTDSQCAPT